MEYFFNDDGYTNDEIEKAYADYRAQIAAGDVVECAETFATMICDRFPEHKFVWNAGEKWEQAYNSFDPRPNLIIVFNRE